MPLVGTETGSADWQQIAYGVYNLYNGMSFVARVICNGWYKYVWNPQAIDQLYDLQSDPHEVENLAEIVDKAEIDMGLAILRGEL